MQAFAVLDSAQSLLKWAKEGPEDAHASPGPSRCWGESPGKTGRNSVCSLIPIYLMKPLLNFI